MDFNRSARESAVLTRIAPQRTKMQSAPSLSMTPKPVIREPQSIPRTLIGPQSRYSFRHFGFFHVEIGVDVLNVVVIVESFHQLQDLLGVLALHFHGVL